MRFTLGVFFLLFGATSFTGYAFSGSPGLFGAICTGVMWVAGYFTAAVVIIAIFSITKRDEDRKVKEVDSMHGGC